MSFPLFSAEYGSGQVVVFLHGMAASGRYWQNVVAALPDDYHSISIDLLGFGRSPKPKDCEYTYEIHLASIIETLERLKIDQPIILVGHSMGALIALKLAERYPERVYRLILVGLPLFDSAEEGWSEIIGNGKFTKIALFKPVAFALCNLVCRNSYLSPRVYGHLLPHLPQHVIEDVGAHSWTSYYRSMHNVILNQTAGHDLDSIHVPTRVLYGINDGTYLHHHDELVSTNQHVRFDFFTGSHQLPIEAPDIIAEAITVK